MSRLKVLAATNKCSLSCLPMPWQTKRSPSSCFRRRQTQNSGSSSSSGSRVGDKIGIRNMDGKSINIAKPKQFINILTQFPRLIQQQLLLLLLHVQRCFIQMMIVMVPPSLKWQWLWWCILILSLHRSRNVFAAISLSIFECLCSYVFMNLCVPARIHSHIFIQNIQIGISIKTLWKFSRELILYFESNFPKCWIKNIQMVL